MSANQEILKEISKISIIDTHEHLPPREKDRDQNTDILSEYLEHYFNRDLISAGLPADKMKQVLDTSRPLKERWDILEPWWEYCRFTGYGRALDRTVQILYQADRIDAVSIEDIGQKFQESKQGGQFRRVLKDISRIETSILDTNDLECDSEFFTVSWHTDHFIYPESPDVFEYLKKETGIPVRSFPAYLESISALFDKVIRSGVCTFKSALAYRRSLKYQRCPYQNAEEAFNHILKNMHAPDWFRSHFTPPAELQNFMMHFILEIAERNHITFQFHTGLQEGNGNNLQNSSPECLCNLFLEYPGINFDLFHISYPYYLNAGALCKNFPNVFLDMCWSHIISPHASIMALTEWIDAVPVNKISGFGGDYCFIDGVAAHQQIARENIAAALAVKVNQRIFSVDRAIETGKMILYDNPKKLFRI